MLRRCASRVFSGILDADMKSCLYVPSATSFWSPGRGDEYREKHKKVPTKDELKQGFKDIGGEVAKWGSEWKDKFVGEPVFMSFHGDYEVLYKFDSQKSVEEWILTTDKDNNEGKSQAEFVLGPNKTGIFRGFINTEVPKDGVIKNAGYCNIKSPQKMISFKRAVPHDLSLYTHLLFRVRGDGRSYQILATMDRYYDIQWHDQYTYALFTRGGPYWQVAKIPFSKFYNSAKGRIQDAQEPMQLHQITRFGLSIADGNTGPFQLEIDYIGAIKDERHREKFAYEMYETSGAALY